MSVARLLVLLAGVGFAGTAVWAGETVLTGRALDALSGHSITVLGGDNIPHVVRLIGIDSLPKTEPWGKTATRFLNEYVARKQVRVSWSRKDELGYPLCTVMMGRQNLSLVMLREGLAWRCARERLSPAYEKAEADARRARRGFWSDEALVAPDEEHRHPKPEVDAVTTATPKSKAKARARK